MQIWLGPQVYGYAVVKEELTQAVLANGKVELPKSIEVTSKVSGKVVDVKVAEGDAVIVGQALFVLENKYDHASVEKARAATALAEARFKKISEQTQAGSEQSLSRAKITLDNARKQYARTRELVAKGYVSQDQASDALRNLTIAQSQLANAQFQAKAVRAKGSDYALAEIALNKARAYEHATRDKSGNRVVNAESAGVLTSCKVARGERIVPGKTLMVILPAGKTRLLAQLDEKNMRDVKLGQPASVVAEGHPNQHFNATLGYINAVAETTHSKVEIVFDATNPPAFLSQGMNVSMAIEVFRRTDALSVPLTAVRNAEGSEPWVMIVDKDHTVRRMVKLGVRVKDRVEILEGLREGDVVLPAAGIEEQEGKRIRLARAG